MISRPEGYNDIPHFHNFSGEQFERLILDLIRAEHPGTIPVRLGPTLQKGFDIQVTLHDGTKLFIECKQRQQSFTGRELKAAVNKFLNGDMAHWSNVFRIITSGNSSSSVKQEKLKADVLCGHRGIKFEYESREGLWHRIRNYPQVVERHLGRAWLSESWSWVEAQLKEGREKKRRDQEKKSFAVG